MVIIGIGGYNMVDYSDLNRYLPSDIECFIFDSIASTNDYLLSLKFSPKTQVCIATEQTQGKGQHNRVWLSNKNKSLLLSIRRVFSTKINLSGLSLVTGLALLKVLTDHGITDLQLKWPNDIYYQDRKLAGILIENTVQKQTQSVVIGLGVNIDVKINCQTPWTDLHTINPKKLVNQFDLSKDLINKILEFCQIFEKNGFAFFKKQWEKVDYLQGKQARHNHNKRFFSGVCCGVNDKGALLIQTKSTIQPIFSSEFLCLEPFFKKNKTI